MDNFQRSARNPFRAFALSRESERRCDPAWICGQLRGARIVEIHGDSVAVDDRTGEMVVSELRDGGEDLIFLGHDGERSWFARDVQDRDDALPEAASLWDFRRAGLHLDPASAGLLAYAKALCHWHRNNRFCGRCGRPTEIVDAGHRRICATSGCNVEQFPRIDPAIIVGVSHGDSILLGRQQNWPERRYSVLAGFVEPGESLEDAVCREVEEEAGIRLERVHYHSSQPWPFPASLMLGFMAEARDTELRCGDELQTVRWVERNELAALVRHRELLLPFRMSIAFRLLADWYGKDGDGLESLLQDAAG